MRARLLLHMRVNTKLYTAAVMLCLSGALSDYPSIPSSHPLPLPRDTLLPNVHMKGSPARIGDPFTELLHHSLKLIFIHVGLMKQIPYDMAEAVEATPPSKE